MIKIGFEANTEINTENNVKLINNISIEEKILVLNNSEKNQYESILEKEVFNLKRALKIIFEKDKQLICSDFVSIFSVVDKNFIPAFSLKNGTIVQTIDGQLIVKDLQLIFNIDCVNLLFNEKCSFFANGILCHTLEENSNYEIFKKTKENVLNIKMSKINVFIIPNRDNLSVSWKYDTLKQWRTASLLLNNNFDPNIGYLIEKNNLVVRVSLIKSQLENNFLFFNGYGKDLNINPNLNLIHYTNGIQHFFIYDLSLINTDSDVNILNFTFNSNNSSTLSSCVLLNSSEYNHIKDYYQGLLV